MSRCHDLDGDHVSSASESSDNEKDSTEVNTKSSLGKKTL